MKVSDLYDVTNHPKSLQNMEILGILTKIIVGVVAGKALSDQYVADADAALRQRMMYGGYRLNNLIQAIYSTASQEEERFLQ
jgi:hypothetical protein